MFINKVLVCVISLKSTGHGEGEFVRLQQGFKAEHVWRTKSLFSCVFYVLFRKRRKHFLALLSTRHHSEAGSPNVHSLKRVPKVGFIRVPSHQLCLSLCLQTVPHNEAGDTWCHPPAAQRSCTFMDIGRDKNNFVSVWEHLCWGCLRGHEQALESPILFCWGRVSVILPPVSSKMESVTALLSTLLLSSSVTSCAQH